MQTFRDEENRLWKLKATVNATKRIREQTEVNLLTLLDDKSIVAAALSDSCMFVAMLYAWCEPQAEELGVDPEAFGELIYGETFDAAFVAFQTELPNFFPPQRRTTVEKLIRRYQAAEEMSMVRTSKLIESPQVDRMLTQMMDKREQAAMDEMIRIGGGDSSTSSPDNSESTPVILPFEN